ncbi:MAG: glycosyltransferase [Cyanobacteria bacterium]|nr:glycosyltransferase [Cyanobacteriota bacterium]
MFSVVIATYRREQVLIDTVGALLPLLAQLDSPTELLVIDQSERHQPATTAALQQWHDQGLITWQRLSKPHLVGAMNRGLLAARGELALFLDDDIVPLPGLVQGHINCHTRYPEAWAVVGQILQPGQAPADLPQRPHPSGFWRDLDFPFNRTRGAWIENAMAGNLSVKRERILALGGFNESFPSPVASRFESELAKRLVAAGGRIRFEPGAPLHHLAAGSGGTRSAGGHLASASPHHGVGDSYFALRCARGWDRFWYLLRKPFREVRTRFHLRHPWLIPVKFLGELRALLLAWRISRRPPQLLAIPSPPSPATASATATRTTTAASNATTRR